MALQSGVLMPSNCRSFTFVLKKNKFIVLSVQLMVFFRNFASILGELHPN